MFWYVHVRFLHTAHLPPVHMACKWISFINKKRAPSCGQIGVEHKVKWKEMSIYPVANSFFSSRSWKWLLLLITFKLFIAIPVKIKVIPSAFYINTLNQSAGKGLLNYTMLYNDLFISFCARLNYSLEQNLLFDNLPPAFLKRADCLDYYFLLKQVGPAPWDYFPLQQVF